MAENLDVLVVPTKKRRRSSLAPRRNKLDLSPSIGTDLHKSIDNNLSPEQRIEELCKLCVQCAVDHVARDCDTEDEKQYLKNVPQLLEDCLSKPEMKEAMAAVCNTGDRLPNPENLEMDAMIGEYEVRINRLKKEEDDWNKLFTDLEEKAAQAERLKDKKSLPESELTVEQRKLSENYLPSSFDLNTVNTEMCQCLAKLKLLVRQHERNVNNGWKLQEYVGEILEKETAELHSKTFGGLDSPRNLIGHEFPTPPQTPKTGAR